MGTNAKQGPDNSTGCPQEATHQAWTARHGILVICRTDTRTPRTLALLGMVAYSQTRLIFALGSSTACTNGSAEALAGLAEALVSEQEQDEVIRGMLTWTGFGSAQSWMYLELSKALLHMGHVHAGLLLLRLLVSILLLLSDRPAGSAKLQTWDASWPVTSA